MYHLAKPNSCNQQQVSTNIPARREDESITAQDSTNTTRHAHDWRKDVPIWDSRLCHHVLGVATKYDTDVDEI